MKRRYYTLTICLLICPLILIPLVAAQDQFNDAGALYSRSVDLANEGKFQEALQAADQALALNTSSLIPLIQTNRAGILVMLGRYEEAVSAADTALSSSGNLTTTFSIAYYNKGDALRHLGRIDEARVAFVKAQELDSSLTPPDLVPTPTKSSLPSILAITGCATGFMLCMNWKRRGL
jgi:tetratricopeptide (TPR) repeat protein